MTDLSTLTIHELHHLLKTKACSATEIAKSVLARIQKHDETLGAFLTVCGESALADAQIVDSKIAAGAPVLPLTGIPIAPKDLYLTKGVRTTAGSKILENFIAPYDSTVIEKCRDHGCVIVGKTNMDEFGMGSSNENSAYKNVRNPWNRDFVPGGSSGGSAAAVSADLCIASLGTDTGGSIRQPASHCNIVGLKPTYGRVSRYGTIAYASSLDQMGPMTKDVEDCAILLNAIAGHDEHDSTSLNQVVPDFTKALNLGVKGLKIGVPKDYFVEGLSIDVEKAVRAALKQLQDLGAELIDIELPNTQHCVATYYIIAPAEASSNLARYDGVRYGKRESAHSLNELYQNTKGHGFGAEVKRRIMMGTYVLSAGYYDAYYVRAQKVRTLIRNDFQDAFKKVDVIAGPVAPTPAFHLGEKTNDPLQMYLSDIFTLSLNLAGLPGMSLPCGFSSQGLPIGLQLIGKALDEMTLLQVAHAYEQSTPWHKMKPSL